MKGIYHTFRSASLIAVSFAAAGCAMHSAVSEPEPLFSVPDSYSIDRASTAGIAAPWWDVFGDQLLSELVETALQDNYELARGLTRIERAEALVTQVRAVRLPQLGLNAEAQRQWRHTVRGDADEASRGAYAAGPLLSWEVDLWGRLRAEQAAQQQELAAVIYDYESLRLSLSARVADIYFQIVEQNLRHELLLAQRGLAENFLDLVELRFLQGDASAVDVLQQRDRVAEIDFQLPVVNSRLGELENRLDVLLGVPPDGVPRVTEHNMLPLETLLPSAGVPADLLAQRPDLKSLQRLVVAQDYSVASAVANRLPRITLDGSMIYRDAAGGASFTGVGAANLLQPLIDWGLRRAQVTAARATFREALLAYSAAYLTAIEDVETTLWQEIQQRALIQALVDREELLDRTVDQTRIRYSLGVTDYLPVLTALQNQQEVQRRVLQERLTLVLLRIQLFRAIGAPTEAVGEDVFDVQTPENVSVPGV